MGHVVRTPFDLRHRQSVTGFHLLLYEIATNTARLTFSLEQRRIPAGKSIVTQAEEFSRDVDVVNPGLHHTAISGIAPSATATMLVSIVFAALLVWSIRATRPGSSGCCQKGAGAFRFFCLPDGRIKKCHFRTPKL